MHTASIYAHSSYDRIIKFGNYCTIFKTCRQILICLWRASTGLCTAYDEFERFEADDVPSTSDVTMVLSQYLEEAERYRSDNVVFKNGWKYIVDGEVTNIPSGPPSKVGKK